MQELANGAAVEEPSPCPEENIVKAALGYCSAVRLVKPKVGPDEVYLTVRLPAASLEPATNIFRGRRVLVTLAGEDLAEQSDGIKNGDYRGGIPTLTDAVSVEELARREHGAALKDAIDRTEAGMIVATVVPNKTGPWTVTGVDLARCDCAEIPGHTDFYCNAHGEWSGSQEYCSVGWRLRDNHELQPGIAGVIVQAEKPRRCSRYGSNRLLGPRRRCLLYHGHAGACDFGVTVAVAP